MKNDLKVGDKIYWYTAKHNKFIIYECEIIEVHNEKYVNFNDGHHGKRRLSRIEFGVIQNGVSLWLIERNDELAKSMFVEYGEQFISKLQKQIDDRLKLIELLRESK